MEEPLSSNFRVITTNFLGVQIFRTFTVYNISVATVGICFNSVVPTYSNRYYKTWSCAAKGSPLGYRWLPLKCTSGTSSVTQMIKDINWHTLEQLRVDSRLIFVYKVTYDLVAIHAEDYLIPNTRQLRHNHQLAYRQIPTLEDYYKYTLLPCSAP